MKKLNCANCENLRSGKRPFQIIHCKIDGFVVPHNADYQKGVAVFWRVPESCQLSDEVVSKTKKQQPKKTWAEMKIEDIKEL
ncbi:MAG: hypothetical protein ACRDBQ_09565 [Shewanella sp.]